MVLKDMKFISIAVVAALCLDWQMGAVYSDKIEALRVTNNEEEEGNHITRKLKKVKKTKKKTNEACSPLNCVADFGAFKDVLDNANIFLCAGAEIKFTQPTVSVTTTTLTITCCGGLNDCKLNGNNFSRDDNGFIIPSVRFGSFNNDALFVPNNAFLTLDGITLTNSVFFFEYYAGAGSTSIVKVPNSGWDSMVYVPFLGCDNKLWPCY